MAEVVTFEIRMNCGSKVDNRMTKQRIARQSKYKQSRAKKAKKSKRKHNLAAGLNWRRGTNEGERETDV